MLARFTLLPAGPGEMTKSKGDAVVTAKMMTAGGKTTGDKSGPTQANRYLMKNFLMTAVSSPTVKRGRDKLAASPRPEQTTKRMQQDEKVDGKEGEDKIEMVELEEEEENEEWQKKLRRTITEVAGLTPQHIKICM